MFKYQAKFETTKNVFANVEFGHGENANLHATFTDIGEPVALSGYTARAIYQPQSKWNTSDFYECPCEIDGNEVIVHWSHVQDNGDRMVKMWVKLQKGDEVSYPALFQLALFATPGFNPATIEPIPEIIDFSQYTLLNAPWMLSAAFSEWLSNDYTPTKQTLSGNVSTLSANVNTLSAITVKRVVYDGTNGQAVKTFCHDNPNSVIFWTESAGGFEYLALPRCFYHMSGTNRDIMSFETFNAEFGLMGSFTLDYLQGVELVEGDFYPLEQSLVTQPF